MLTRLSLANRAIVALLSILIVGIGLTAVSSIKQELIPSFEQPTATVYVAKPGASPAALDEQVVIPLVTALRSVSGVDEVRSNTASGSSSVTATWAFGADSDKIFSKIESTTATVIDSAPEGAFAEVTSGDSNDSIPLQYLSLSSTSSADSLAEAVEDALVPALERVPGVAKVKVSGRVEERVLVTVDPVALSKHSIDQGLLGALLRTLGTVVPAGTSVSEGQTLSIEVGQENSTLDDIAAMPIPTADGPVLLSEVALIELVPVEQSSLSRANGHPSIGLLITKTPEADAVRVSHALTEVIDANIPELGSAVVVNTIFDQSTMIEESLHDLSVEGGLGLLFAVIVILVFLFSVRATIITAISIPLSLLIAVIGLNLNGYSLNIFTLAGLTVAVGRVVDDSIVVIENITRRRGRNGLTVEAVAASVREVSGAVIASTLTTVAVFLPIAVVGGTTGELFRPFAITVTVALLASLLVALTVVPVLAYWFMRKPSKAVSSAGLEAPQRRAIEGPTTTAAESAEATTRLQRGYLPSLGFALRRPVTMVLLSALVFIASMTLTTYIKTDFLGSFVDERSITVSQKMPLDSSLAAADAVALELEKTVKSVDAVESYQTTAGAQGNPVTINLVVAESADPKAALKSIEEAVATLPRADQITVSTQATQATSSTIDVIVKGSDETKLTEAATAIVSSLEGLDEVKTVTTNLAAEQPVLKVSVDRTAAAAQGFSTVEVATAIASAVEGEQLGSVSVDGVTHDLVLRSQAIKTDPASISALTLPVSALQQQKAQKSASDNLVREQEGIAAKARADAQQAGRDRISELVSTRAQAANQLADLQNQLAQITANPPPGDATPVTAGELSALQHQQLLAQLSGSVSSAAVGLSQLDEQIVLARESLADAAVQQAESDRLTQAQKDLQNLKASSVRVGDLATVTVVNAPATVTRIDGKRAVTISVEPSGDLGATALLVTQKTAKLELPAGVTLDEGGAAQEQAESFADLGIAMLIALALVYIVLVATFRSFMQALLLLIAVPFAATGAIVGLLVTETPLGLPALIGMLMLIGIVVTNAIVLIDLINEYRRRGSTIDDAVSHGARLRLRPVIMTAAATIFSLLPMAFGLTGSGGFISKSLAVVVIGGLISSTVLTLLVLPALYAIHEHRVERRAAKRRLPGLIGGPDMVVVGREGISP